MKGKILFNDVETYLFSDIFITSFYMPFSQMQRKVMFMPVYLIFCELIL